MASTDLLIVGAGLGGITVARALRAAGDERIITILSAENEQPYDRPPLSKQVLLGTMRAGDFGLLRASEDLGIDLRLGVEARALAGGDDGLTVTTRAGRDVTATDVVIATGSRARWVPPFEPGALDGVHVLRSLADAQALAGQLAEGRRLVVVGGGFIGLEAAAAGRMRGCEVVVLEREQAPLTRVLGHSASELISELHREQGVDLRCGVTVVHVEGDERVRAVVLDDGTRLEADAVVVGVGVVPNTEWLDGSGVLVDNGVVCDASGRASLPGVWAVGDAARWPNAVTGLHVRVEQWQAALDQAQVVAANLSGGQREWDTLPYFWSDQFGISVQFAGHPGDRSQRFEVDGRPVLAFADRERAAGILTMGNPRLLARARRVLRDRGSWDDLVSALT